MIPNAADKARGPLARTWRDDRGTAWCVFHDRAVPSVVAPYGNNHHIVQSKDWIVMTYEWNTERRVIALDGRPHAPASVRTYAGDSRGRWEGDTLVIETTNFTPKRSDLQSDIAIECLVPRSIDLTNAACADQGGDLMGAESRADFQGHVP